jgi:5'-3' exonuclease
MGVKGLYSYLRAYRHPIDIKSLELKGKEGKEYVGVDGLSMLYKFRGNAAAILAALKPFQEKGYTFIFVFDGKPPDTKIEEVETRKGKRNAAIEQANVLQQYLESQESHDALDDRSRAFLERKVQGIHIGDAWYVSRDIRRSCKGALWAAGIQSIKATGEADDLLLALWHEGKIHHIVSTDMDFLVAGIPQIWIPSPYSFDEITLADVLIGEDVDFKGFQDASILCGMDAGAAAERIQPPRAFSYMRHYGSLDILENRQPQLWNFETSRAYVAGLRARFANRSASIDLITEKHKNYLLE